MSRFISNFRRYSPVLGLLILAVLATQTDLSEVVHLMATIPGSAIVYAAAAYGANVFVKAIRWHRMASAMRISVPLTVSVSAFLSGALYGMVTIGRLGEMLRVEALLDAAPSRATALSTCIADRLLDLAFLALVALVGSAVALGFSTGAAALASLLLALGAVVVMGWRWRRGKQRPVAAKDATPPAGSAEPSWLARHASALSTLVGGGRELLAAVVELLSGRGVVESLAWTALAWAGYFYAAVALAAGLGYEVPLFATVAATAIAAASAALPISFQGVGTREAAFSLVLAPYGLSVTQAATLSVSLLALFYVVTVPLGLVGVVWRRTQLRRAASA